MMKYILVALTFITITASAQQSELSKEVNAVKKAVLELNQELGQLEQELLSPKGTEVAFYFSMRGGQYFVPLSIEINAQGLDSIHHIYTEQEVKALRVGAVHPVSQSNLSIGMHKIEVIVRGVNQKGDSTSLAFEREVEKTTAPLMLEVSIQDNSSAKKANVQLAVW